MRFQIASTVYGRPVPDRAAMTGATVLPEVLPSPSRRALGFLGEPGISDGLVGVLDGLGLGRSFGRCVHRGAFTSGYVRGGFCSTFSPDLAAWPPRELTDTAIRNGSGGAKDAQQDHGEDDEYGAHVEGFGMYWDSL